jgi:hypothetical protein
VTLRPGRKRGSKEGFIGEVYVRERLGFSAGGDRMAWEADVLRRVSWLEVDGDPIGGAHLSVEEREGRIPFRV